MVKIIDAIPCENSDYNNNYYTGIDNDIISLSMPDIDKIMIHALLNNNNDNINF